MSAVVELLAALEPALLRYGRRWFLFGAQAVIVWGRPRMSADVDISIEAEPSDATTIVRLLNEAGFVARFTDVAGFAARTRVVPLVHEASGLPLDIVLERRSSLDIARVRDLLCLLEATLSRGDLVSVFEAQMSRE